MNPAPRGARLDFELIADLVPEGARVLDVGCSDGALIELLRRTHEVDVRGLEVDQDRVKSAVARGLSVIQGDANTDLVDYPDNAFEVVIFSQTIQAMRDPRAVLQELVRIGRRVIVSLPNFGFWRVRLSLLFGGRMPMTSALDAPWHATENIHLCTILDFLDLADTIDVNVERAFAIDGLGRPKPFDPRRPAMANWASESAMFLVSKG
ncbi:MAG: methionine biosynthesis protein MetW [Pirellulales bacterium]|nr:methionine biosynthesis protein MetW [Pirellulales bacterium]